MDQRDPIIGAAVDTRRESDAPAARVTVDEFMTSRHAITPGVPVLPYLPATERDDDADSDWIPEASNVEGGTLIVVWHRLVTVDVAELEKERDRKPAKAPPVQAAAQPIGVSRPPPASVVPLPPQPGYASVREHGSTLGGYSVRERGAPTVSIGARPTTAGAQVEVRPYPGTPPPYEVDGVVHGATVEPEPSTDADGVTRLELDATPPSTPGGAVYRPRTGARSRGHQRG